MGSEMKREWLKAKPTILTCTGACKLLRLQKDQFWVVSLEKTLNIPPTQPLNDYGSAAPVASAGRPAVSYPSQTGKGCQQRALFKFIRVIKN